MNSLGKLKIKQRDIFVRKTTSESDSLFGLGLRKGQNTANLEAPNVYKSQIKLLAGSRILESQSSLTSMKQHFSRSTADLQSHAGDEVDTSRHQVPGTNLASEAS